MWINYKKRGNELRNRSLSSQVSKLGQWCTDLFNFFGRSFHLYFRGRKKGFLVQVLDLLYKLYIYFLNYINQDVLCQAFNLFKRIGAKVTKKNYGLNIEELLSIQWRLDNRTGLRKDVNFFKNSLEIIKKSYRNCKM